MMQKYKTGALTVLSFLIFGLSSITAETVKPGTESDYSFETGIFLKQTVHINRKNPPRDWKTRSGAMGVNLAWESDSTLPWYIEEQRIGADYISAGCAYGNIEEIKWGLKILEWGFSRMTSDGEFKHSDNYHSASFFVEAAAHSLLLLAEYPEKKELSQQIDAIKPKLYAAAKWMARLDIHLAAWEDPKAQRSERPYTHRRYLDAAALGEAGILAGDKDLIAKSDSLVREGISSQKADGVNMEKGGYDSHYQALGLMFACRYYLLVADDSLRKLMLPMLEKGFIWLTGRINEDGTINETGNTRTGQGLEKARSGNPKAGYYIEEARALAAWAELTGDVKYENLARLVFTAGVNNKK